ncbi:MAG: GDSL-type esterase/lipase family protein, partial [Planctomycetaceae bacterium]
LAVIMIGTNNAGHRQDRPEHTAAGIKAIVSDLRKRMPKMQILLLGIFPRGQDRDDRLRKLNTATNAIIQKYADDKHVHYLDVSDRFLADDTTLSKSIMPDLLHPNERGYRIWAEAMEPQIHELLDER